MLFDCHDDLCYLHTNKHASYFKCGEEIINLDNHSNCTWNTYHAAILVSELIKIYNSISA